MKPTFRASMNWLHTWAGVVLGGVLFAIFWMGSLAVFDKEVDRWMMPASRLPLAQPKSVDGIARELQPLIDGAARWYVTFPTERDPTMHVGYRMPGKPSETRNADPATSALLPDSGTWAGTRFLYPFHYRLHIRLWNLGYWIVGLSAMAMLALCVTGVIVHRKIFTDFFTFRADKKSRRLILDLHNVTGVLGLPFHFVISLSGLIIFFTVYFPSIVQLAYDGDQRTFLKEAYCHYERPRLGRPAESASFDSMVAEAQRLWGGQAPQYAVVNHPGDAAAYVQIGRVSDDSVADTADVISFDAATGTLLHRRVGSRPVMTAQLFISRLHMIQFRHWTLRWLYFALGLAGCMLIATGYLFWLESRRKKHVRLGLGGVRLVEGVTIGSVAGIVIATLAFFVINRLLPLGIAFAGYSRAALEVWTFYLVWLATFGHAWLRPGRAWIEQCWIVAALAVAAVLLNWTTTGDHPIRSLSHRHLWAVAGMDLLLLAGAALAALTGWKLQHRASAGPWTPRPGACRRTRAAREK